MGNDSPCGSVSSKLQLAGKNFYEKQTNWETEISSLQNYSYWLHPLGSNKTEVLGMDIFAHEKWQNSKACNGMQLKSFIIEAFQAADV